jgi:hypothetical protein
MYLLTEIVPLLAFYEFLVRLQGRKEVKMIHWWNNLLNTPLTKMLSRGKYEVLRRDIEEANTGDRINLTYIFNQGGSVLDYNGGSVLLYN